MVDDLLYILCPECGKASPNDTWKDTSVHCDECGAHDAIECPKCNEVFDLVRGSIQHVPKPEN